MDVTIKTDRIEVVPVDYTMEMIWSCQHRKDESSPLNIIDGLSMHMSAMVHAHLHEMVPCLSSKNTTVAPRTPPLH